MYQENMTYTGPFTIYFFFEGIPQVPKNINVVEDEKSDTLQFVAEGKPSFETNDTEREITFYIKQTTFCKIGFGKIIQINDAKGKIVWEKKI